MHNTGKKEPDQSSVHSGIAYTASCPSWWNAAGSQIPQSSFSKSLNLNLDSPTQHCHNTKQLGRQLQDQESSSTQSTGQSHHDAVNVGGGNLHGHCISGQSGNDETYGKRPNADGHVKSVLSLGGPDLGFPRSQVDHSQSVARFPYAYVDPYYCGIMASYGPQAIIHPQMLGMATARVPLPLNLEEDGPIYVNAKQYRGIIRRRMLRAKLEAQSKLIKDRKPYLHESRHRHAINRPRGSGGRFLNTKKLQQSKLTPTTTTDSHNLSDPVLQLGGILESDVLRSENSNTGASATCSDVTSVSNNDDIIQRTDLGHPTFPPHMGGGGITCNGSHHLFPINR
ncbi:nuclear transcription factor Y subunit A-3-like isoform X1 [Magnolia sinica]|uniref:nuclear transcription factor Y subunit A-3-like isoform X1 n=1 Tax=Magnolia sinica TaxID=86752 RepID=UPI00265AC6F6|nr:nuclear transcription factor Y subunit A-3-like isoform X1 [Magnolia sinica]XP_058078502.1 nuclear transcription factor Y subunit A-3-like isoform X1 [Magnolia sinica]